MSSFSFVVLGEPAPQGSKRGFLNKYTGKVVITEQVKRTRPWRQEVLTAAPTISAPLDGPLIVKMVFTLPRPKSARKIDFAPCKTPDLSKLARAVEDSMKDAGLFVDDARIVEYVRLSKVWFGFDPDALPTPGVVVACAEIGTSGSANSATLVSNLYSTSLALAMQRIRGLPEKETEL